MGNADAAIFRDTSIFKTLAQGRQLFAKILGNLLRSANASINPLYFLGM